MEQLGQHYKCIIYKKQKWTELKNLSLNVV